MLEESTGKELPTTQGKNRTKKQFILEWAKNRPISTMELANKIDTTVGYVRKVLSQERNLGKKLRGREGRIFAHGKAYYGISVMPDTVALLKAPVINFRTGMKQIGFKESSNPCSCQIHSNGRILIWPHSVDWKSWITNEFIDYGWTSNVANFVVEQATIQVSTIEGGVKPLDPTFLPQELWFEAEWGLALVKDNTPEKNVLEVRFLIPKMQQYLGLPEIRKRLDIIEQGSVTLSQSFKSMVALFINLNRQWELLLKHLGVKEES